MYICDLLMFCIHVYHTWVFSSTCLCACWHIVVCMLAYTLIWCRYLGWPSSSIVLHIIIYMYICVHNYTCTYIYTTASYSTIVCVCVCVFVRSCSHLLYTHIYTHTASSFSLYWSVCMACFQASRILTVCTHKSCNNTMFPFIHQSREVPQAAQHTFI